MSDLNQRLTALESIFSMVNLGAWSNDQEVPLWLAWRIRLQLALQAEMVSAVDLSAQVKLAKGTQDDAASQLVSEIVDDWCLTRRPPYPPRPDWGSIVAELGALAERLPTGSVRQNAAFELCSRVVNRAHELSKSVK